MRGNGTIFVGVLIELQQYPCPAHFLGRGAPVRVMPSRSSRSCSLSSTRRDLDLAMITPFQTGKISKTLEGISIRIGRTLAATG